jgi:hypothetical protein
MIEESLLKSNFLGRDGFVWWIGQVAPAAVWRTEKSKFDSGENKRDDKGNPKIGEGWAYRCKVRIVGYHTFDGDILPDNDLPWAHVSMSPENGTAQGSVGKTMMIVGGETVYGFFLDGEDAQQPVIVGCLHRNESASKNFITPEFLAKEKSSQFKPFTGHQGPLIQGPTQIREKNPAIQQEPTVAANPTVGIQTSSLVGDPVPASREQNKPGSDQLIRKSLATQQFVLKGCEIKVVRENGCNDNIIGKISKVIQDFVAFVNRLEKAIDTYIDPVLNTLVDITTEIKTFATRIVGIVKFIINNMRNGIIGLITKLFGKFIGLIVPLPQQPPVASATKNIIDIIFCVFEKLLPILIDFIINMLTNMVGKAINAPLCAVEQAVGSILAKLIDAIDGLLSPIFSGLNWLLGAVGQVKDILGKVSSIAQQILSFLACDRLKCETPIEWSPCGGPEKKGSDSWNRTLKSMNVLKGINSNLSLAMSQMSLFGYTGSSPYKDCTEKALRPKNQKDQIPLPPGVIAPRCIPPEVEIFGDGIRAQAVPIVNNSGSIIAIEILNRGKGYSKPPTVVIRDNTNHGSGAQASASVVNGEVTSIYLNNSGSGYCPTNLTSILKSPTYVVTANKYSFYEGETVTFTINTENIPDGTVLEYEISGDITPTDIEGLSSFYGSVTLSSGRATKSFKFKQDSINENAEIVIFDLLDKDGIKVARTTVVVSNELSPVLAPAPNNPIESPPGTFIPGDGGGTGFGNTTTSRPIFPGIGTQITPETGIGTGIVGIVTSVIIPNPGTGYTGGDTINVGPCVFEIIVSSSGAIVGVKSTTCTTEFSDLPTAIINTNTGEGARAFPVLTLSPKFNQPVVTVNQEGIIKVVDCI